MQIQLRQGFLPALALLSVCLPSALSAQGTQAVLLDGRVLEIKQPLELFATEGPIWNLVGDPVAPKIQVTGKTITIPVSIDGVPFQIGGSSVLGQDGSTATGIGAENFDRLFDANAINRDRDVSPIGGLGPRRLGPARSIFSTSENRRATFSGELSRSPEAQSLIEANYFAMVQSAHAAHASVLPVDFLETAGLRGPDATTWEYPTTAGGTFKSAGHVYVDPATGEEHYITDVEAVIELSEEDRRFKGIVTWQARCYSESG